MLDQHDVGWFRDMNRALADVLDDDAFAARIEGNVARMDDLASELLGYARAAHPGIGDHGLQALAGTAAAPSASPLIPDAWRNVA